MMESNPLSILGYPTLLWGAGALSRGLRRVRVTRTRRRVGGRYYEDYYVKVKLPKGLAERVEAYNVYVDEETGRITLEPVYREEHGD